MGPPCPAGDKSELDFVKHEMASWLYRKISLLFKDALGKSLEVKSMISAFTSKYVIINVDEINIIAKY